MSLAEFTTLSVTDQATFAAGYALADTGAALLAAPLATIQGALALQVLDPILVSQATTLQGELAVGAGINYSLSDTAAALAAASATVGNGAINITATDAATVAQATVIDGFINSGVKTYSLADTGANLILAPNAGIIFNASAVTVTDSAPLLVSDVFTLQVLNANTTFALGYNLADTAFELLNPLDPTIVTGALQITVTDTPLLSLADFSTLSVTDHATFAVGYNLIDTSASLLAAPAATVQGAILVQVLDPLLVSQATTLHSELAVGATMTYDLSDTAAQLVGATPALVTGATLVTVTDTATVAQATTIHSELGVGASATYGIIDAAVNIATALTTGNAGLAAVEAAASIAVIDPSLNLTVNADEFINLPASPTLLSANDTITIDGADVNANLGTLDAFGGNLAAAQTLTLGGVNNGSYTVDLGTSGETAILMEGAGVQHITAASGVVEKFSVGATNHGGSTIDNLGINDSVDTVGAGNPSLTTQVAQGSLVTAPGQWAFSGGVLTWWDPIIGAADHLTLTLAAGASNLSLDNNQHLFTVI